MPVLCPTCTTDPWLPLLPQDGETSREETEETLQPSRKMFEETWIQQLEFYLS